MAWTVASYARRTATAEPLIRILVAMLENIYLFFELLSFIVAVVLYPKYKHTPYKYLLPYLLLVLIYEYGTISRWFAINHRNLYIANINWNIFFAVFGFLLTRLTRTFAFKKWMRFAVVITLALSLLNEAFFQGFWDLDSYTILLQFIVIIVFNGLFFYELMHYANEQLSVTSIPGFWLNTGLLFFCLANFLFYASFAIMAYSGDPNYLLLFQVIVNIAIAILYSCLTAVFLCFRKRSAR
ncbi:hypothetical protein [Mucilaginibacter terrenus]|uniref:hypothetical protein n=1 Tax=Mucilaginibacter terrenus TaxID=2482727 RepID=UPI0010589B92|nr:hypothetical protein [Mucilaginibacter terrenus]